MFWSRLSGGNVASTTLAEFHGWFFDTDLPLSLVEHAPTIDFLHSSISAVLLSIPDWTIAMQSYQ